MGCASDAALPRAPAPASPASQATLSPAGPAASPTSKPPAGGQARSEKAAVDAAVQAALVRVSELRGLALRGVVHGTVVAREELLGVVAEELETSLPLELLEAMESVLIGFGLVDAGFDYGATLDRLMNSQLAGLYDPDSKRMLVAADLPSAQRDATLAHELVHALQDQHFDLRDRFDWQADAGDRISALQSLAEGDATAVMVEYVAGRDGVAALGISDAVLEAMLRSSFELDPALDSVPGVILRAAIAPYVDGFRFVRALRQRGGWAAVDAAWQAPPASTEQLLHPDKYWSREAPVVVALPPGPTAGTSKPKLQDVYGEQAVLQVLEEWLPRRAAVDAASGWDGDRLAVYGDAGGSAVAWHLRYESQDAAADLAQGFARGAQPRRPNAGGLAPAPPTPGARGGDWTCRERPRLGPFGVLHHDRDVVVVLGPFARDGQSSPPQAGCADARGWATRALARD